MAVTIPIGLMNEKSDKLHVKLGEGKRSMKLAYRQHAVELAFAITVWNSLGGTYPNLLMLLEGSTDVPKWCYAHMYVAYSRVPSALRFPLSQAFRRHLLTNLRPDIWATKWRMDVREDGYWRPKQFLLDKPRGRPKSSSTLRARK